MAPHFPRVQATVVQDECVSFRVDDVEVMRYNTGWQMKRPYVFPVIGPSGRCVTRMGHPHDPLTHRHHYSVWVAHNDVNKANFWADHGTVARQVHRNLLAIEDGIDSAAICVLVDWVPPDGNPVLTEERTYRLVELPDNERLIDIHLSLKPAAGPVTFGPTPFGLAAVRVAKTMTVKDGGGIIRNSAGAEGEQAIFWKPAQWCDYSGLAAPTEWNGIAFFAHPSNVGFPPEWHVREDGWMGCCLSREKELTLPADGRLEVRYQLYVHRGMATEADIPGRYKAFAASGFTPCQK